MKGTPGKETDDLDWLRGLIEAEEIKSVIDKHYRLEQMAEDHRYVEKRIQDRKCRHNYGARQAGLTAKLAPAAGYFFAERRDTVTKEKFLTVRWNNLLTLALGAPTLIYIIYAFSTSLWTTKGGLIGLSIIGVLY